jgi:hypothetical protein
MVPFSRFLQSLFFLFFLLILSAFSSAAEPLPSFFKVDEMFKVNEIMYNPPGPDNNLEFVEISGTNNLSGCFFGDLAANDTLDLLYQGSAPYSLIVESGYNYTSLLPYASSIYSAGSTLGNNLNDEDAVFLYCYRNSSVVLVDFMGYNSTFADGNGYSLELVDGIWMESSELGGTPGRKNTATYLSSLSQVKLVPALPEMVFAHSSYSGIFRVIFPRKADCSRKENVDVHYYFIDEKDQTVLEKTVTKNNVGCSASGIGDFSLSSPGVYQLCGEVTSLSSLPVDLSSGPLSRSCISFSVFDPLDFGCDYELSISSDRLVYSNKESISYSHQLVDLESGSDNKLDNNSDNKSENKSYNKGDHISLSAASFPFQIEYWVEDLSGDIVKDKVITSSLTRRSYTPSIDEKDGVFYLKARVLPSCLDLDQSNNYAEKLFLVLNANPSVSSANTSSDQSGDSSSGSYLKVKDYPSSAKFGDLLTLDLELYRGDTTKYSISSYLEKDGKKVSSISKVSLKKKYYPYLLSLPLQVKTNCDQKISEGSARLVIEGLGEREEKDILLSGTASGSCDSSSSGSSTKSSGSSRSSGSGSSSSSGLDLSFSLADFPSSIKAGEQFPVTLDFQGDEDEHLFKVWSYLYRGSKCYSCCADCPQPTERDSNLIEFKLSPGEKKSIGLDNQPDLELKPGEYSFKVLVNKDGQKTNSEFIEKIDVASVTKESSSSETGQVSADFSSFSGSEHSSSRSLSSSSEHSEGTEGLVVYESNSNRAQKLVVWFLLVSFALVAIIIVWKNK